MNKDIGVIGLGVMGSSLARNFAESLKALHSVKLAPACDAMLVVSPEHERTFREAGWSKDRLREELHRLCEVPGEDLVRGAKGIDEGLPESVLGGTRNKFRPGGLLIVRAGDNGPPLDRAARPHGEEVLVERYIPGRELTVAVMGDRALGVTEIRPRDEGFYDYEHKYTEGRADHLLPAPVPEPVAEAAMATALAAHRALGCRGVSRCDFRYDDGAGGPDGLYLLELNTQPGMTPLSLVPEQAAHAGIDFEALVAWMVEEARCDP